MSLADELEEIAGEVDRLERQSGGDVTVRVWTGEEGLESAVLVEF